MNEAERQIISALQTALKIADMNGWNMVRFSIDKETVRQYLMNKDMKVITNTIESIKTDYLQELLNQPVEGLPMTLMTPPSCRNCSNHPNNGGSGICHCILGNSVTY